jgi:hypothetical protein
MVSAMAGEVSELACRRYTRRLVQALHQGKPVAEAVAQGRRAALLHTPRPAEQLDWAMPAMFLASSLDPAFSAIDPGPVGSLVEIADELKLRRPPVFIGRREILGLVDEMVGPDPARRLGFVAAVREGPLAGLGGTRLLQEIGFRLLLAGHVPILLGPFSAAGAPADLRAVLVAVLDRAIKAAELLDFAPVPLSALGVDREFDEADRVSAAALAALPADEARTAALETLSTFARRAGELDPGLVRDRLSKDLARLADSVAAAGAPFGRHSRVVVLGDEAHAWVEALPALLTMIGGRTGLGTRERPVPVVLTASLASGAGPALRTFRDARGGMPGYAFPELAALSLADAALGFQWVLLHPWNRDGGPECRQVYARARAVPADEIHDSLGVLKGIPTKVKDELYTVAQVLRITKRFVADDDEQAFAAYLGRYS